MKLAVSFEIQVRNSQAVDETVDSVIGDAGIALTEEIRAPWPSRSGRSRRGWQLEGSGRDWVIVNDTPYTAWINPKGQRADLIDTLIPALLTDSVNKTAEALADQLPVAILSEVSNG